ncbi:hypothetical protein [Coleofasciculus sp. FACHB-129]|uniref:hypothetical protein n=1 Tax=Coleofasciculus sp. FACHB-129 TaxID=2692785 RepID=UPI0016891DCF|nr:hypothetical protein [Coleofasciculus sp. FACHB-129]MBD1895843.1 hypothetical protein [Coleofasciculus sp. FACHB-129]
MKLNFGAPKLIALLNSNPLLNRRKCGYQREQRDRLNVLQRSACSPAYPGAGIPSDPSDLNYRHLYPNFKVFPADPHGFDRDSDSVDSKKGK